VIGLVITDLEMEQWLYSTCDIIFRFDGRQQW